MIDSTSKKILLVRNDNIGDLICTTPAIEALRKRYPNNQIDLVVQSESKVANDNSVDAIVAMIRKTLNEDKILK